MDFSITEPAITLPEQPRSIGPLLADWITGLFFDFDYTWIMTAGVAGAVLVLMVTEFAACVSLPSAISAW